MYKLTKIYKSYADKDVLLDVSLNLYNEVVALIGENGAGKTTLLKIMLGEIDADDGIIEQHGTVSYVPQHPSFSKTIRDCFDQDLEQWQIDIAMQDVGLDKPMNFETINLSGGQKTRLSIAMAIAGQNNTEVLLLDEPTNNLDAEAFKWLLTFIRGFKGSVMIVSHDRAFINKVCTKILELKNGTLRVYSGNYDEYKAAKELERIHQLEEYETNIEERERLQKLLKFKTRQMQSTSNQRYDRRMGIPKITFNASKNASQANTGRQMKALISRIDQLGDIVKPDITKTYDISLSGMNHTSKLLVKFEGVKAEYMAGLLPDFVIRGNDRLRIHGANGTGKSTILKLVASLFKPMQGTIMIGSNVSIGYLSQDIDQLDHRKTVLENLETVTNDQTAIYREMRALVMSNRDLSKKVEDLSRGQQTKVSFAKLLLAKNDLLILDEPTNHLDIPTKELIEHALRSYSGGLLVSSHDEYFIQAVGVTRTIILGEKQ